MIQRQALRSRKLHVFHSNATKTWTPFWSKVQPGTFKCARTPCKTCPFIHDVEKITGPKRSIKFIDHFTRTSANVIHCITCTYSKKIYIRETGRRLGDRFREHLRELDRNEKEASKLVSRLSNLPNHSKQRMAVCGLTLYLVSLVKTS